MRLIASKLPRLAVPAPALELERVLELEPGLERVLVLEPVLE